MAYIKKLLNSLYRKQDGAVAIIVAVALIAILFGVLSLSIDLNRTQTSYTHNYNGTDAAALAGAEMWLQGKIHAIGEIENPLDFRPGENDMLEYAKKVMIENFGQDQTSSVFLDNNTFKVLMAEERLADGKIRYTVKVDACARLKTPIANVPSHTQDAEDPGIAKTCTSSTAGFDLGKLENAEVAFALDFTESMYWHGANQGCPPGSANAACPRFEDTKAYALQQAMDYVFSTYFDSSKTSSAFASIVPYTAFVNVYPYNDSGLVTPTSARVDFDGKRWLDIPPKSDGTYNYTAAESKAFYSDPSNAWSQYSPIVMTKTTGYDLRTYVQDPNYFLYDTGGAKTSSGGFAPFYTFNPYDGTQSYETSNYVPLLSRIPTIRDAGQLQSIISNPDNTNFLPFDNYHQLVQSIANEGFVYDPSLAPETSWGTTNATQQYAKMVCEQYTIAAAADERVDGALMSNYFRERYTGTNRNKNVELHESFPIQPLTNDYKVLNNVLQRYVADTRLKTNNLYDNDAVVDFEAERIDKARLISIYHKTSSLHGLMWAWFTINNAWQDIWDSKNSLHENYVGGDKSARDGSTGDKLPSNKHFKHIILISDGFDNDGCDDLSGGTADVNTGSLLGRYNSCDAYTPIQEVTDKQYNDLCTTIKTNGTTDLNDDTTIHIVTLDFDAGIGASDSSCPKATGENNRFAQCATAGEYYNNVTPDELRRIMDDIFAGILTKAVPVRLLK